MRGKRGSEGKRGEVRGKRGSERKKGERVDVKRNGEEGKKGYEGKEGS